MVGRGLIFQALFHLIPPSTPNLVGVKADNFCVMIEYQVDGFTCTCSAEHFVVQSHIYPGFMGKVS